MALWLAGQALLLASKSEVRGKILRDAGVSFEARPASIDERAIEAKAGVSDASAAASLLARAKAQAVAALNPARIVLGADQTLALGAERFSKPKDRAGAAAQLRKLRGKTHELHAALALVRDEKVLFETVDRARLTMRDFSDGFLEDYLDGVGDAAFASVGGYQLESLGVQLFERIEGDYFTILGLPLLPLLGYLRQNKFLGA